MSKSKQLLHEMILCVQDGLNRAEFKKRAEHIYTCTLSEDILGWVGLNRVVDTNTDTININPVIGIRNQPLERLVAELLEIKFHQYIPPSISNPLGYLLPENLYREWSFTMNLDLPQAVDDMISMIITFGKPFMLKNMTLEALYYNLSDLKLGIQEQKVYRIPVVLFLLGRRDEAEEYLRTRLKRVSDRNDMAAQWYRRFAEALSKRLLIADA